MVEINDYYSQRRELLSGLLNRLLNSLIDIEIYNQFLYL